MDGGCHTSVDVVGGHLENCFGVPAQWRDRKGAEGSGTAVVRMGREGLEPVVLARSGVAILLSLVDGGCHTEADVVGGHLENYQRRARTCWTRSARSSDSTFADGRWMPHRSTCNGRISRRHTMRHGEQQEQLV